MREPDRPRADREVAVRLPAEAELTAAHTPFATPLHRGHRSRRGPHAGPPPPTPVTPGPALSTPVMPGPAGRMWPGSARTRCSATPPGKPRSPPAYGAKASAAHLAAVGPPAPEDPCRRESRRYARRRRHRSPGTGRERPPRHCSDTQTLGSRHRIGGRLRRGRSPRAARDAPSSVSATGFPLVAR